MVASLDDPWIEALRIEVGTWGLCKLTGVPTSAFYPKPNDSQRLAKSVCAQCEVRAKCLTLALETNEVHGIWGGLNQRERNKLRKRRLVLTRGD